MVHEIRTDGYRRGPDSPDGTTQRLWDRHRFQPGRLIVGLVALILTTLYGGDAGGWWSTPGWVVIPVLAAGLGIAGSIALAVYSVRRRRSAISASSETTEAPARISGRKAMR
ncbi:hypothetical protein ABT354_37105 [Streptomyces sp. NPDC000594]|uniref:hypothetical protein n=1 Tax=Streptomyces sp. NPDC000594 TaxID=3154261 RepID=UPI00331A7EB6